MKKLAHSVAPQVLWLRKYCSTRSMAPQWTGILEFDSLHFHKFDLRWALGILVFQMLVGSPPFLARGDAVFKKIKNEELKFPPKYVRLLHMKKSMKSLMFRRYQEKLASL